MAIKGILSKISQFSLKSKVGLGVMAVLCGVLSWSAASSYFSGDDEGGKRRKPPAKETLAQNDKNGESGDSDAKENKSGANDDDSPVTTMEGSKLFDRFNNTGQSASTEQPPPQNYYGNADSNAGGEDRYNNDRYANESQSTDASATSFPSQGAAAGNDTASAFQDRYNDYRDAPTGQQTAAGGGTELNNTDSTHAEVHDPFASSRFGGTGSSGDNTNGSASTDTASSFGNNSPTGTGSDRYGTATTPRYGTTPGYSSGTQVPHLDRSTPALDRSSPASSAATNQLTNNNQAFRSSGNQHWSNPTGTQPRDSGEGIFKGGQSHAPNYNPTYPGAAESQANTVRAGGNRRMESINSTPSSPPTTVAENQTNPAATARSLDPFNSSRNMQAIEHQPTAIDQTVREFTAGAEDSFWTIAKQAYGDGGYFAALHAFNSTTVLNIEDLRVGDIIQAPSTALLRERYPTLCPEEKTPAEVATPPVNTPGSTPRPDHQAGATSDGNVNDDNVKPALATGTDQDSQVQQADGASIRTLPPTDGEVYVSKQGDDLFAIARDQLGSASRWADIYELNKNTLGEQIEDLAAGIELKLPRMVNASSGSTPR